jgi:hypothetical protein
LDSFNADDILFDLAGGPHYPILHNMSAQLSGHRVEMLTKELVVFSAYDKTRPTRPASTPVVTRAVTANRAVTKIIVAPTSSSLMANQRFTDILGR